MPFQERLCCPDVRLWTICGFHRLDRVITNQHIWTRLLGRDNFGPSTITNDVRTLLIFDGNDENVSESFLASWILLCCCVYRKQQCPSDEIMARTNLAPL